MQEYAEDGCYEVPESSWDAPEHIRTLFIKKGKCFIPSVTTAVLMCAMYDGVEMIHASNGHTYVPLEWMRKEYPEYEVYFSRIYDDRLKKLRQSPIG